MTTTQKSVRMKTVILISLVLLTRHLYGQQSDHFTTIEHRTLEARSAQRLLRSTSTTTAGQEGFDVKYYKLDLRIPAAAGTISGVVTMEAVCLINNLSSITLDLMNTLIVDEVYAGGVRVTRTSSQQPTTVTVALDRSYAAGEKLVVVVHYHGVPGSSGFGSFRFATTSASSPWIWSLSEPYGAKDWWPSKDHPGDKADSVDVWVTCDARFKVGSQGKLVAKINNGDGTWTHRWSHRYPIATYLVSVALAEYSESSGWFKYSPTDSMLVLNYFLPSSPTDTTAIASMKPTLSMLQIFSDLFGLYPFIDEKYGHAQFGWPGGMEHQTMTSLGSFSENLIAHEMAHQWFGDMITMRTWPHIWLNEGFATYAVALYHERKSGPSGYWNVMNGHLSSARTAQGTVFVQDTLNNSRLFSSSLVYSKGAVVLHMLRHVVGDSMFFKALYQYATDPKFCFGTATTEDLRSVFETVSGRNLDYFFKEWIYGERFPSYQYEWGSQQSGSGYRVRVTLVQTPASANPAFFTMPIDFRFKCPGLDTTISVFNAAPVQTFVFDLPKQPTQLLLDPNNWILKDASGTMVGVEGLFGTPKEFALFQNYPNPFNPSTVIPFELPVSAIVGLEVFNQLGERVRILKDNDQMNAGRHLVPFVAVSDAGTPLPSGVYYARLIVSGRAFQTRKMIIVR